MTITERAQRDLRDLRLTLDEIHQFLADHGRLGEWAKVAALAAEAHVDDSPPEEVLLQCWRDLQGMGHRDGFFEVYITDSSHGVDRAATGRLTELQDRLRASIRNWGPPERHAPDDELLLDGVVAASPGEIMDLVEKFLLRRPWPEEEKFWWSAYGIDIASSAHLHLMPLADTDDSDAVAALMAELHREARRRWADTPTDEPTGYFSTSGPFDGPDDLRAVFARMLTVSGVDRAPYWIVGERAVVLVATRGHGDAEAQATIWVTRRALIDRPTDLVGLAARATREEFLRDYDHTPDSPVQTGRDEALLGAMRNPVPRHRVAIAARLLDDGADASYESGPGRNDREGTLNALHLLFDEREHDVALEAPLLRRLLDGGADINLRHRRWSTPLRRLIENTALSDDDLGPFYDVIFERDDLDFGFVVGRGFDDIPVTLRDVVAGAEDRSEMARRLRDHDIASKHVPAPRDETGPGYTVGPKVTPKPRRRSDEDHLYGEGWYAERTALGCVLEWDGGGIQMKSVKATISEAEFEQLRRNPGSFRQIQVEHDPYR